MTHASATASPRATADVWLRGNVRPVIGLAAFVALVGASLSFAACFAEAAPFASRMVLAYWVSAAVAVAALAAAAARPRLVHRRDARRGDLLEVRLAPGKAEAVPLEAIECFFMGSQRLEPEETVADDRPTHRVGTLVMRVAERAMEWQSRPTFTPWGTWREGAIVFDGRWCEPLSVELARRLSGKLVDAKRATIGDASMAERRP